MIAKAETVTWRDRADDRGGLVSSLAHLGGN